MPFASDAQRRLFYARPELHKYIAEYEAATGAKKLPARLHHGRKRKKRRTGQSSAVAEMLALRGGK